MRRFALLLAGILFLFTTGCLGRGGSGSEEEYDAGGREGESTSGEEIARYLDETGRSETAAFGPAERDPFHAIRSAAAPTPPPARIAAEPRAPEPAKPAPRLVGIMNGSGGSAARIDTETCHVGDRVAGYAIVAIGEDHIILERDGKRHTVEVGRSFPGPGEGGIGS